MTTTAPEQMVVISRADLMGLVERVSTRLPHLYKFPEDIVEILGGHVPVATVRSWKTLGYLRTVKVGRRAYVKPADWQWFLENHKELMASNPRNRVTRLPECANG